MKCGGKGGISYLGGTHSVLGITSATISNIESSGDGGSFYSTASTLATVTFDTFTVSKSVTTLGNGGLGYFTGGRLALT